MKSLFLASALAAGLAAAVPASADAADLRLGLSAQNGHLAGHLTLVDHDRSYRRDHRRGRRHHRGRRGHYCQGWRRAHRTLHRRFEEVELLRRTRNRRGHRIFIVSARRGHHGRRLRVRYNACTRRVTNVRRMGHHGRHHGRRDHRRDWRR